MKCSRKEARRWLDSLTKSRFLAVVDELKLSPMHKELILLKHVSCFDNSRIGIELSLSTSQVSHDLSKIYDRVAHLLSAKT